MLAASATVACAPRFAAEPPPVSPAFPLGVASGDATSTGVVLWTRCASGRPAFARVWREEDGDGPATRVIDATPAADGLVSLEVTGLSPGTWHRYQFVERAEGDEAAHSEVGRFRTAFAPDALLPLRVGAVSCTHQKYPLEPLLRAAERVDLDAFLILGDALYADGAETSDEFRAVWHEALGRHPHQRLRASTSLITAWDDHEVVDNFTSSERLPLVAEGRARFFEYQPVRRSPDTPDRIWRSLRWGRTAEFFVLDCRGERRPTEGLYVSPEQLAWLERGLAESPCVFKVILNSVPITEFPGPLFGLQVHDRWEGFPAQRDELLRFIEARELSGVLWVSGDFHLGTVGRVSRSGPGSRAIEALVGPGGQRANTSPSYPSRPQFDFATGVNNFVLIDLDPATVTARLRYVSGAGAVIADHAYRLG
jgi:alkaline phosphatase D